MISWQRFILEMVACLILLAWSPLWVQIIGSIILSLLIDVRIHHYHQHKITKKIRQRVK